jgi:hypothetical protein
MCLRQEVGEPTSGVTTRGGDAGCGLAGSRLTRGSYHRPVIRSALLTGAVLIVAACAATPAPTATPTIAATASPSASAALPAIVGEWVATHDCLRIFRILTDAGLEEFLGDAIYGNELVPGVDPSTTTLKDPSKPCEGAVQREHSHFFLADGRFGSKDYNGDFVDSGMYTLEGHDIVVINDQRFRYRIDGDELTLEPPAVDISGCTDKECRFMATWVLMVAMPGTTWTRGRIEA